MPQPDDRPVLVGDEISRSLTHVSRLRAEIADAHSRKKFELARTLIDELGRHANNMILALNVEELLAEDESLSARGLAREQMQAFDREICWPPKNASH